MPHDVLLGVRELVRQGRYWIDTAMAELQESSEADDSDRRVRFAESARNSIEMARKSLAAAECDISGVIPVDPSMVKAKRKVLKGGLG